MAYNTHFSPSTVLPCSLMNITHPREGTEMALKKTLILGEKETHYMSRILPTSEMADSARSSWCTSLPLHQKNLK